MSRLPSVLLACAFLIACGDKSDDTGTDTTPEVDGDGDGYTAADGDCDDGDDAIYPDADEVCDGVDNNCDGDTDEEAVDAATWFVDADGDGHGSPQGTLAACSLPDGYASSDDDCDDGDAAVSPSAAELCNDLDDDCDGDTDEDDAEDAALWYADGDGDGYGLSDLTVRACAAPPGYAAQDSDCDDADPRFHPGAIEDDCTDPSDYNCDGSVAYADSDGDGFAACEECDDSSADIRPDADEVCDGVDNNCDGEADEDTALDAGLWYIDADSDGHGDPDATTVSCLQPAGTSTTGDDCDDTRDDVSPAAEEVCDTADNDCDGDTDEDVTTTFYADSDGDGYGDEDDSTEACTQPSGYVTDRTDCDDSSKGVSPAASEVCDGVDNNCDGSTDGSDAIDPSTFYADGDSDGYGDVDDSTEACTQPSGYVENDDDCDDAAAAIYPGAAETCDGEDNDCDGSVDEGAASTFYADSDSDGYGDVDDSTDGCTQPSGYVANADDCDDGDSSISPAADEVCDGVDNNCDGDTDGSDAIDPLTWYGDLDEDGYGDPLETLDACEQPSGYVDNADDCDDLDGEVYPGAEEVWFDGVDADCDSLDGYTIDYLSAGDLVITEIMANPDAVSDSYGEWIEVYNASGVEVNLLGLVLKDNASSDTVDIDLIVAAGGYVVLGIDGDTTRNGSVTVDFDWSGLALGNSGDTLSLSYASTTLDAVDYTGWAVVAGVSLSLSLLEIDATSNDDVGSWCAATDTFGDGDYGSPGADNPEECLPEETDNDGDGFTADEDCDDGDSSINPDADEVCDGVDNNCDGSTDGSDAVDLATWYGDLDEDGYGDPLETLDACDQPSGYVENADDCDDLDAAINPGATELSGDSVDQDCDGELDPSSSTTLTVADLVAGDLVVTEVMQNPNAVADSSGEWFEVYNDSGSAVDLSGLVVKDTGTNTFTVSGALVVAAGGYVVFGKDSNTAVNGGVTVDYAFGTKMDLGNGSDSVYLTYGSTTIDAVVWDNGATFPDPTGYSMSLDPDARDTSSNDTGSNWCEASSTYGDGDYGTPGADNDEC